jgi:hypothetical protein
MSAKVYFALFLAVTMTKILAQPKAVIGTTLTEFEKEYPKMPRQIYEDEVTFSEKFRVSGFDVSWSYKFKKGRLEWIYLQKYIQMVNQKNFDRCLKLTKKIITDFTTYYGDADNMEEGDTTYVDPYVKRHWGYDVIRAVWKNYKGMKIKVRFTFKGGKGDYSFLVSVDFHDSSYPF